MDPLSAVRLIVVNGSITRISDYYDSAGGRRQADTECVPNHPYAISHWRDEFQLGQFSNSFTHSAFCQISARHDTFFFKLRNGQRAPRSSLGRARVAQDAMVHAGGRVDAGDRDWRQHAGLQRRQRGVAATDGLRRPESAGHGYAGRLKGYANRIAPYGSGLAGASP